ncbi:DUF4363 family protein [Clostridium sp. DL1XJH146]
MNEALVVLFRGIISFFTLLIFTRALGKQQLGEISYFDYILGITIGAFAAELTVDLSSTAWPHWVGLCTWTILGILMQYISLRSIKIAKYINDKPIIVIHNGKVLVESLKEIKFTFREILEQLRFKDIYDIKEVKDDVKGTITRVEENIFNEQWHQAEKDIDDLQQAWTIVQNRIQFVTEKNVLEEMNGNISRLQGAIIAQDRAMAIIEISEIKLIWKELG